MRTETSPIYSYIQSCLKTESQLQQKARALADELGLGAISISQVEAHLIGLLIRAIKPQKIVEIGTLTGLSCLYFLDSSSDQAHVWTFEKSTEHAQKATQVLQPHIDSGRCKLIVGDALEKLPTINSDGPFDVIFIDGNKAAYYDYWKWAEKNCAPGGLIIIDNVFLAGAVWGDQTLQKFGPKQIKSVQEMTKEILNSSNFISSFVPTNEGLLLAIKTS